MLLEHPEPWEPPKGTLREWAEEAVLRVKAGVFDVCGTATGRLQSQMLRLEAAEMAARRARTDAHGFVISPQFNLAGEFTLIEVDLSKAEQQALEILQHDLAAEIGRQFERDHIRRMVQDVLYSAGPVKAVVPCGTKVLDQ